MNETMRAVAETARDFLSGLVHALPECTLKNELRGLMLKTTGISFLGLANKGDVVLQCGCWKIETVVKWSRAVGKKGRVIIIEASEQNARRQQEDVARRGITNVTIVNKGVWERHGTMTLQVSDRPARNKLREQPAVSDVLTDDDYQGAERISVDSIDNIVKALKLRRVDLISCTVSGAEREAIKGMKTTMKRFKPRIWMRCVLRDSKTRRPLIDSVISLLKKNGYRVRRGKREARRVGGNLVAYHG
ncbi:FkbM family methyltransferase [Candidatus Woesearchaeota archaeon]|nr:MAG: FkbM family methyltransferase [Candidatus Woesearchaeota archaeon]